MKMKTRTRTRILLTAFVLSCSDPAPSLNSIGVRALDFREPTAEAMRLINGFVGCEILVAGSDVTVMSTDAEPCGLPFHESIESGHSAMAYRCGDKWEIHVEQPGNVHTQLCIIAHELGHVLGLKDGTRGIMDQHECPEFVRLSDYEVRQLRKLCSESNRI